MRSGNLPGGGGQLRPLRTLKAAAGVASAIWPTPMEEPSPDPEASEGRAQPGARGNLTSCGAAPARSPLALAGHVT